VISFFHFGFEVTVPSVSCNSLEGDHNDKFKKFFVIMKY